MLPTPYLLLSPADATPGALSSTPVGGPPAAYARVLNVAGRWAVHGSAPLPLLVWPSTEAVAAQAAADRAARSRGHLVQVVSRADAAWVEGHGIQPFGDAFESALHGAAAQSAAKARRLRTEADKLEAFCLVVRAASVAADQAAFAEVGRAASKALRAKFGGGSITSAFAWLAGQAGQQALESVLTGEVELAGTLSTQQVAEAMQLARQAEALREKG